jgi:hypothetical protein
LSANFTSMNNSLKISAVLVTLAISSLPVLAADENAGSAQAVSPVASEPAVINRVVYLAKLPSPAELMKGAEVQGIRISRIDQAADRIVVAYEYSGGRTVTFAYTLLSAVADSPVPVAGPGPAPASAGTVVYSQPAPATQVVYAQPPTVYYSSPRYVSYYDPAWDFWGPLALGVGIGWIGHGGGWHGGHGWHGGGGHGGGWHH